MIFKTDGWIGTFLTKWSQTYKGKTLEYRPPRSTDDVGRYETCYDLPNNFCETTRAVMGTSMFLVITSVTFAVVGGYLLLGLVEWYKILFGGLVMAGAAYGGTATVLLISVIIDGLGFLVLCGFMFYHGTRIGILEFQDYRARAKPDDYVPRAPSQGWINFKEGVSGVHRKFCPLVKWEEE